MRPYKRDEIREKGAMEPKETNYERYFGTPEKAAKSIATLSELCVDFCLNKCDNYDNVTDEKCERCALEWLNDHTE